MRQNANSWLMIVLFAIIIFVFAINFGPWAGQKQEGAPYAAIVNNKHISLADFRTTYMSQFARIKQFRPDYEEAQAERDGLKQMVLDQLISRELLTQLGRSHHLKIGPQALALEIKDRVFGPDTDFDKEEYKRRIQGFFQTTIAHFEEQVEKELIAQQMADLLSTPIFISDHEAQRNYSDKNTKLVVEYIKINPEFYKNNNTIKLEQVLEYTNKNQDKIAEYYNNHLSDFQKEKQVQASHILVKFPNPDLSAEEKAKLKEKATNLALRVKKGEDFAKVASSESDDIDTRPKGGDLGFFSAGMMVEEFAQAAFALEINQISDVVESPFGFHIIKVTDKMDEQKQTLAQATNEIAETLIKKEEQDNLAKKAAQDALAQLKSGRALDKISIPGLVFAKSEGNAPVADETSSFNGTSSYIPKIGKADAFVDNALRLKKANESATEVLNADDHFYAMRLKSREDADMSKFESEKEALKTSLLFPRKRAFVEQYLSDLKARAKISYNQDVFKDLSMGG
jgi:peptidyl-prolyl cis-trans isomerase D